MHLNGPVYHLFVPKQAAGADLVYFDFFNASGSAMEVELLSVRPVVSGEDAVVGVVGLDLFLTRTTAVGTGGTAATREGATLTACTFTHAGGSQQLHPKITARLTPTGGATAGAVLAWDSVFTEETSAGAYLARPDLVRAFPDVPPVLIPEGSGFRVVQGDVASVGNIGFNVSFRTRQK